MKKILFIFIAILISINASATKWYIATTGSDIHGKGTLADPWASLKHATDTVTFAGDTIMIAAGNYTISTQVILDNVSLMGAGVTSVLTSTITGSPYYAIKAASTEGTIVNQSISYIKIVGGGTAYSPLGISGRSGVEVHHCTFENFVDRGVCFSGTTDFTSAKPTIFATNNSFHDNTITNCASGVSYSRGNLNIGGQSGMIIYNNTINQTDRSLGVNGFGIKAMYYGYNKGVKIYNNYIYVPPKVGSDWCFGIEMLHNLGGIEIYNNEVFGAIDISATTPPGTVCAATDEGGYGFALKIYGNTVGHTTLCVGTQVGIDLEHDIIGGTYIYRNHIRNVYKGIALTMSGNMTDINIYYNLIDSIGYEGVTQGQGIGFTGTGTMDNLNVFDNVILGHPDKATLSGMYKIVAGNVTNSSIRNNIIRYFDDAPMDFENATFNTVSIENNIFYGNGSSNNITWTGTSQTDVTEQNNYKVDPLFIGGSPYSYALQSNSPAINAGLDVGLSYDYTGRPIYLTPDIGAYEYGTFPASTGLGWEPKYFKENVKDTLNINKGWKIKGETVTASARSLNRVDGVTSNIQTQLDALKIPIFTSSITIAGDTTVTAVIGKIVYQAADSSFYGCRSTVANKKWYKLNE